MNHPSTTARPRRRLATAVIGVLGIAGLLAAGSASAAPGQSPVGIRIQDDCDPATFNAAVGPGTCIGDGETTFDNFLSQLVTMGNAPKWNFSRTEKTVRLGRGLAITNRGGEFHTFTEVAGFGGGCIPFLNDLLRLTAVPECAPEAAPGVPLAFVTTGVPPGEALDVSGLDRGTHRFQCLIHPWMHSTITVK